jgi:hypothetical protein
MLSFSTIPKSFLSRSVNSTFTGIVHSPLWFRICLKL